MADSPWAIRPATAADLGYVWDALSKQLARREATRWAAEPSLNLAADLVQRRERTLARYLLAEAYCRVAAPREPDQAALVCGFIVFDPLILTVHYVYTGRNLRRCGIARSLFLDATHGWGTLHASHLTKPGCALLAGLNLDRRVRYDPYRAFFARDTFISRAQDDGQDGKRTEAGREGEARRD